MIATRRSDGQLSTISRIARPRATNRRGCGIGGAKMLV